jgi:peptidoglycan hydrolase CwlO-like protein
LAAGTGSAILRRIFMPVITDHKMSINDVIDRLKVIQAFSTMNSYIWETCKEAIDYLEEKKGMDGEEAQNGISIDYRCN